MVSFVDDLEGAGYVARSRYPHDRRAYVITLTRAGNAALRRATRALDDVETALLSPLSVGERRTFTALLARLQGDA